MTTTPTDAQMKLARECAAHGFPKDTPYYKNCMAGNYDEFGIVQAPLLAIQATEARAQGLVEALEPFEKALGKRQLLCKDDESVTWSAITVGDLRKARQALATWRRT